MSTIGQRNNNPLNIRTNPKNHWVGLIGDYRGFCVFGTMDYGLRAAMILLSRYIIHYDLVSIRQIVYRFAPPSENESDAYIAYCTNRLHDAGLSTFPLVAFSDSFFCLLSAMARYESCIDIDCDSLHNLAVRFHLI